MNEFETKVLDINIEEIVKKLRELGAKESPEVLLRRFVFDMESDNAEWLRLRTNGTKTTLAYKHKIIGNIAIGKTIEIETDIADFDKTSQILSKIPFKRVLYQENKTHIFHLNDIEFSIDTWPQLGSYLEIESTSIEKVQEGLRLLGLAGKDIGDKDISEIYIEKVGFDLNSVSELKFD